jgi:hypothetical protein
VESIINMCLDVTGFSKDNMNARKYLAAFCDHPLLEVKTNAKGNLTRPHVSYCLKSTERKEILKWLKKLKFPDCYTFFAGLLWATGCRMFQVMVESPMSPPRAPDLKAPKLK